MKTWFRCALLCFLVPAVFAGRMSAADAPSVRPAAPVTIFIVRHGEKSATSGDVPLSDAGRARAASLAAMLAPAAISVVFSSDLTFARETAGPAARQHNLEPVVIPVRETDKLLAALEKLPAGSIALVVNHSGNIPALVEKLGGTKPSPIEDFDRMFVVSRHPRGPATVAEVRYGSRD